MEQARKQAWWKRGILLALILTGTLVAVFVPPVRDWLRHVASLFSTGDFEMLETFVASYGGYAAVISFFLMIFQALAAPLPAFLLDFANCALFGFFKGFLLTWISSLAAATLCFYIGRILGREVVEKFASRSGIAAIEDFFTRHGRSSVLVARLLPFISFDYVSYFAGLTPIGYWEFLVATAVGELPATLLYSYVGSSLTGGAKVLTNALLVLFGVSGIVLIARQVVKERREKRTSEDPE
ncbi:MAG: TVP38/TMEM64 family protein [Clostridia bacterium]|nr:TVP38/TMEM64 family protein [Clostridia bacterium]